MPLSDTSRKMRLVRSSTFIRETAYASFSPCTFTSFSSSIYRGRIMQGPIVSCCPLKRQGTPHTGTCQQTVYRSQRPVALQTSDHCLRTSKCLGDGKSCRQPAHRGSGIDNYSAGAVNNRQRARRDKKSIAVSRTQNRPQRLHGSRTALTTTQT